MKGKADNLINRRFGRLTVICRAGTNGGHSTWLCECSCGERLIVQSHQLKTGNTKSCGCLRRDLNVERGRANAFKGSDLKNIIAGWWLGQTGLTPSEIQARINAGWSLESALTTL